MGELIKINAKKPLSTKENSTSNKQKTGFQSQSTHVDQILFLQRTIGNQAVQRLMRSGALQAKLRIGQPGDVYEQEADRVADEVMRMPEPEMQRQVEPEEEEEEILQTKPLVDQITPLVQRQVEEEEEEMLQAKSMEDATPEVSNDLESQINAIKGGGRPLAESERAYFEPRFGVDFSQVKVHTGAQAAESAGAVNAKTYTLGQDVVFGEGQYNPQSKEGKRLIAHELVHVIQQKHHRIQTIMRTCNCNSFEQGRIPTRDEAITFGNEAPNLRDADYCITGEANSAYNCYAWSIGIENRFLGNDEIISEYGDNDRVLTDRVLTYNDLNRFYYAHDLIPTENRNYAEIWVYGDSSPKHAAKRTRVICNGNPMYESKLGEGLRIAHLPEQLEGSSAYGNYIRAYVRFPVRRSRFPTRIPHQLPSKTQPI